MEPSEKVLKIQKPEPNYEYLCRIIDAHANCSNPAILDYGCGSGSYALYLRNRGYNVFGVEIDERALETARNTFRMNGFDETSLVHISGRDDMCVFTGDYIIPFEDETFDVIYSMVVFEHISNIDTALRELHRVLKKDGFIFTCFPPSTVLTEPHLFVPFANWLPYSSLRRWYLEIYNRLGVGRQLESSTQNEILKKYIFYRSNRSMDKALNKLFFVNSIGIGMFRSVYLSGATPRCQGLKQRVADWLYESFVFRNLILRKHP